MATLQMLTKFESKSNRVKGNSLLCPGEPIEDGLDDISLRTRHQGWRSIRRARFSRHHFTTVASSYGTTRWAPSLIVSKSTTVSWTEHLVHRDVLLIYCCVAYVGPVRAVAFHPSRPLLVTGGDDYKIKVWGEYGYQILLNSFS